MSSVNVFVVSLKSGNYEGFVGRKCLTVDNMGKNLSKGVAAGFLAFLLAGTAIPAVAAVTPTSAGDTIRVVQTIPRWDLYSRVSRLEDVVFTKDDAKKMQAEIRADMKAMQLETRADMAEVTSRTNLMFIVSISFTGINTAIALNKK